jgi:hypothetical protein
MKYILKRRQERESEQILNLLLSEETMNFKAIIIALTSVLTIDLANGNRTE